MSPGRHDTHKNAHNVRVTQFDVAGLSFVYSTEVSEVSKTRTTHRICDPTIYGILIVSHMKTHTQGRALMSLSGLLCIACSTLYTVFTTGDNLAHGGDVSSVVCVTWPPKALKDSDSTTSGMCNYFPTRVSGIFM